MVAGSSPVRMMSRNVASVERYVYLSLAESYVVPRSRQISEQSPNGPQAFPFFDARKVRNNSSWTIGGILCVAVLQERVFLGGWMPGTGGGYRSRHVAWTAGVIRATSSLLVMRAMAAPKLSASAASCAHFRMLDVDVLFVPVVFPRDAGEREVSSMHSS